MYKLYNTQEDFASNLNFKIRFFVKKHNNFYSNLLYSKANVK